MNREELFSKAVSENHKMIFAICLHFYGAKDPANDAYQETLIKIWKNIENFRGESKLSTWISRITANVCLTGIQTEKRKSDRFTPINQLTNKLHENSDENYEQLDNEREKLRFFKDFKSRLNPLDRLLVSLYLEENEYREISEITGLSESNARTRIHRIKNQIKKEWEECHGTGRF